MDIEYEATFPNVNKEEIREKLQSIGAKLVKKEFFMKVSIFDLPTPENGKWLRIRDEEEKITMSLKAITGKGIEGQKEICLEIDTFESAEKFLESIGCKKKSYQENKREI